MFWYYRRLFDNKRGSRAWEGGGRGSGPPPLRFVRDWVLCRGLTGWRGGPMILFILSLPFFLARFARQYYTNILHVFILPSSIFNMERSSFLHVSLIQIMKKKSNFPSIVFMKGHFLLFFCLELHNFTPFKPKVFWGGSPNPLPLPDTFYNIKTTMTSVFVERGACNWTKDSDLPKIICMYIIVSKVDLNHTLAKGKDLPVFSPPSLFFFFACQNFPKVGPPLTKIPGSAIGQNCTFNNSSQGPDLCFNSLPASF